LSNSVYRYSDSGVFQNVVLTDNTNLNQPSGMQISPDGSKIYVSSSQGNQVIQYDYNYTTFTATNATVFADVNDGIAFPSSVLFSQDGSRVYVSNLGGTGVAQFNTDGSSAGASLAGGSSFAYSGLAFAPNGSLLVGGYDGGTVATLNAAMNGLTDIVSPLPALAGASGLLVHDQSLYVTGLMAQSLLKFNIDPVTGAATLDASFNNNTGAVTGLAFPQGMMLAPDGNGMLVGILGSGEGQGSIARYGFDGTLLGTWASPGGGGFGEATSFVYAVPEPSVLILTAMGCTSLGLAARRRRLARKKADESAEELVKECC
jgi:DNA-binding beta-propeller fold protein YncE